VGSGATGFKLAYDAREVNGISVHVNGMKVETFSWIDGNGTTLSTTLIPKDSELVWDSTAAGYNLSNSDIIEIVYETLAGGAIAFDAEGDYTNSGSGSTGPQGATGPQGPQGPSGSGSSTISGTVDGHLIPDTNEAYDLGSPDKKFKDIYMSGNTLYMGGQPLSIDNGQLTLNGNPITGSVDVYNSTQSNTVASDPGYDIDANSYSQSLSILNSPANHHLAMLSPSGEKIFVTDTGSNTVMQVWKYDSVNNAWSQDGNDLETVPIAGGVFDFGEMDFSKDSNTLGYQYGNIAKIFGFDGNNWVQKGQDFDTLSSYTTTSTISTINPAGTTFTTCFPKGITLNQDGTRVAITYFCNSTTGNPNAKHFVKILDWNSTTSSWDFVTDETAQWMNMSPSGNQIQFNYGGNHGTIVSEITPRVGGTAITGSAPGFIQIHEELYSDRRGGWSGDGSKLSCHMEHRPDIYTVYANMEIKILEYTPGLNLSSLGSITSPYNNIFPSTHVGTTTQTYVWAFNFNENGTRIALSHENAPITGSDQSIWELVGGEYVEVEPATNSFNNSMNSVTTSNDLTKILIQLPGPGSAQVGVWAILNLQYVLVIGSLSTLNLQASPGDIIQLRFDDSLAFSPVQTCHIYKDYDNRMLARVISNTTSVNGILKLEVISVNGTGSSTEYTITLG
jgi:hypothetical protein